jgi:replicative DNA helicase
VNPKPVPMHNQEAERAVLSAMLRFNGAIADVVRLLCCEDLYADAHQRIWRSIIALWNTGQPADLVTVADHLHRTDSFDNIGGSVYLAEVFETSGTSANVAYYAQIVKDCAQRRRLHIAGAQIVNDAETKAGPAEEVIEAAERIIFALSKDGIGDDEYTAAQVVDEVFDLADRREKTGALGLSTGFSSLDNLLAGLPPGELIVIAARPSIGKTTLGMALALDVSLKQGAPVLFVSLEQGRRELVQRALCNLAGIDSERLRHACLDDGEKKRFHEAGERFRQAKLTFCDASSQRLLRIAATARRAKSKGRLELLVIDYLQLVEPESRREPRHEQVASISRGLKRLARELGVPVVAMAQLNRESEQRTGREPRLADPRESGSIEADADTVMLLHRTEKREDLLEIIVAKQRNGPTDKVVLKYDRARHRYSES